MLHLPINHHLQPLYRTLAGLIGLYSLLLGIVGIARSDGVGTFQQHGLPRALGLPVNPAFGTVSIVVGAIIVLAALVGRNAPHYVNLAAGVVFQLAGLLMLAVLQTNANILGFSVVNCVVSFILGLALMAAGMYGKIGPSGNPAEGGQAGPGRPRDRSRSQVVPS